MLKNLAKLDQTEMGVGPSLTIFFTSVLDCRADGKCPW